MSSQIQCSSVADFDLGVTLGTGSFGRVRICTHTSTNQTFAIKMLRKTDVIESNHVRHVMSEKNVLNEISEEKHPFIVNLHASFQDDNRLYFVMECVIGGEFFTHLRKAGRFDDYTAKFYAAHIILIFEYLHSKDVVYRDLKPENLLLDKDGFLKITDFGFAKKIRFKTYTLCGTPEYIAPELIRNQGHGKGVDWWTLGILIFEMLTGEPPFLDNSSMGVYAKIQSGRITFPRYYKSAAKKMTKGLLTAKVDDRLGCSKKGGVEDVKSSKWVANFDWEALLAKELEPPIQVEVSHEMDTSNFDEYDENDDDAVTPQYVDGEDPFVPF
mmetsp:Transcript_23537/g.47620  ORF Transcript_23537/g.47620 Transcript_23537/m.47620 type:complete len:327 (-) Transcript_23537:1241-2221(-)